MHLTGFPYEIQIRYLLGLSYSDILSYCQVNQRARQICEDPWFWRQKAEHDFGFSYQIEETNPAANYARLEKMYTQSPQDLLPLLVYYHRNQLFKKLLSRADLSNEKILNDLLNTILDTNNSEALRILLETVLVPEEIIRGFFFTALGNGMNDSATILGKYYDPRTDQPDNLRQAYLVSLDGEYFPVLDYLLPLVDPSGYSAFSYSLEYLREATFEHLVKKYPQLFRNLVNQLREEVVRRGDFEALELLQQYL